MKKIRIGWFIPVQYNYKDYNRVMASVWIRCLQLIEPLQTLGYESTINQPWKKVDIAIFLRVQGSWAQKLQRYLQWRGVKTIFSVIVNYYEREGNIEKIRRTVTDEHIKQCITMTREANAVVTCSHFLRTRAEQHNDNVFYLPDTVTRRHFNRTKNTLDFDRLPLKLIWSGKASKAHFLEDVYNTVSDLPIELIIIADEPPLLNVPYKFVQWRYETFPEEIVKGDICISPRILDNSYDYGHSNFKIVVFLAQGVPVLASPQDSYLEVVNNGDNGFICPDLQSWRSNLLHLIEHRSLLQEMPEKCIQSAEPYLTENVIRSYDQLLRQLVADNVHNFYQNLKIG